MRHLWSRKRAHEPLVSHLHSRATALVQIDPRKRLKNNSLFLPFLREKGGPLLVYYMTTDTSVSAYGEKSPKGVLNAYNKKSPKIGLFCKVEVAKLRKMA